MDALKRGRKHWLSEEIKHDLLQRASRSTIRDLSIEIKLDDVATIASFSRLATFHGGNVFTCDFPGR